MAGGNVEAGVATARGVPRVPLVPARALLLAALALLLATASCVGLSAPAAAHTELEDSSPAAGATVVEPVSEVALTFSLPVTLLGESVVVTGADGPVAVAVTQRGDGTVVVATPDVPLGGDAYAVEWIVAAQDGHPLDGEFSFTVAPEPSPSAPGPAPTGTPSPEQAATADASPEPTMSASHDADAMSDPEASRTAGENLDRALARAGSAIALWALLVAGGALAFVAVALRGPDAADAPRVLAGVRWCGALLLSGLVLRVIGRSALLAGGSVADGLRLESLETALAGSVAWVIGLQAVGGVLLLAGARRSLAQSWLAVLGAMVAGAGQVWGGHSATAEPRAVVLAADIAHLVAAAVWVGGVLALVAVLRRRRRHGQPFSAVIASRFGVVAAGSFVVVGLAGVALTWTIIDDWSDLWTTAWGVTLLVKVALVLAVAVLGAVTHFRVVPRLAGAAPERDGAVAHLRRTAAAESVLFALVVIATAVLVASAVHA